MQESSNYYSIIPMEVLLDKKLSDKAKLIYAELSSLDSKAGFAWCSNKYLAELFDISVWTVSKCIQELAAGKYIKCEYETDNARKIYINKVLSKITRPIVKNHTTSCEKPHDPIVKNANKESIDEIVNKESIKENITVGAVAPHKREKFVPPTLEEVKAYIAEKGYKVDAEKWWNYYDSKDWYIGKNKMVKWKSAVATWNTRNYDEERKIKLEAQKAYIKDVEYKTKQKETSQQRDNRNLKKLEDLGNKIIKEWNEDDNPGNNKINKTNQNAITDNSNPRDG